VTPAVGEAVAHLRAVDPIMRELIDRLGPYDVDARRRDRPDELYGALVRSIIGQQVSTASARAIFRRLTERFGGRPPTPEEVLADDPDELRSAAGLSRAKLLYLRSLAEHVVDGSLALDRLDELPDEEVIRELTAVKGIGVWSAHLFLMFTLGRPDVVASGDLGIRRAVMIRYGLTAMPTAAEVEEIAERWRPHRTLASLFLWQSLQAMPA
jgi:DNA-3-methyladenine glycosylase II